MVLICLVPKRLILMLRTTAPRRLPAMLVRKKMEKILVAVGNVTGVGG
jgi:hypothetical protein